MDGRSTDDESAFAASTDEHSDGADERKSHRGPWRLAAVREGYESGRVGRPHERPWIVRRVQRGQRQQDSEYHEEDCEDLERTWSRNAAANEAANHCGQEARGEAPDYPNGTYFVGAR